MSYNTEHILIVRGCEKLHLHFSLALNPSTFMLLALFCLPIISRKDHVGIGGSN